MRCYATVIAWAHGQLAWIFRRRRRPLRTSRAAACSTRSVFSSALARSPSRARSFSQASRICPVIAAVSQAALTAKPEEEVTQAGVLRAGMRSLAAIEDPHRRGPADQLVPVRAFAQLPGQLGDGVVHSSIQQARCAQPASAQVSLAQCSRTSPCPSIAICQACSGTSRSAVRSRSPSTGPAE